MITQTGSDTITREHAQARADEVGHETTWRIGREWDGLWCARCGLVLLVAARQAAVPGGHSLITVPCEADE